MTRSLSIFSLPNRREVLTWAGALAAYSVLPSGCGKRQPAPGPAAPVFFTPSERSALSALADAVIPPDEEPGATALGCVDFIERLVTAFEVEVPALFVQGPYSDRQPFADERGLPGSNFSENDFAQPLPLDRVQRAAWTLFLYGSDGVEGGGPNDAALGKVIGLRQQLRDGLAAAIAANPAGFEGLDAAGRGAALKRLDPAFRDLVTELVIEGAFGAPEYGGNKDLAGWAFIHFGGDSQPLGYTQFDTQTGLYRERLEAPMSGPNPEADPAPMDKSTRNIITQVVGALGGREF